MEKLAVGVGAFPRRQLLVTRVRRETGVRGELLLGGGVGDVSLGQGGGGGSCGGGGVPGFLWGGILVLLGLPLYGGGKQME